MSGEKDKPGIAVIVAVIGAIATIVTACITGFFGMLPSLVDRIPEVLSSQVATNPSATLTLTPFPSATSPLPTDTTYPTATITPTLIPSPTDLPEPTPTLPPPLLFASRIAPNGQALDPGAAFKGGITDLYAVFPAGDSPPGTIISEDNPVDGAYYAFLRADPDRPITRIGWRWIYEGEVVNEFEMDIEPGSDFWLSAFNYDQGGLFGNRQFPYGTYTIVILLGGNPSVSGEVVVEP